LRVKIALFHPKRSILVQKMSILKWKSELRNTWGD